LLHQLKYKSNKDVGKMVGKLYGYELKESQYFQHIDFIIPVPLHPKKLKRRGFNQSSFFAEGLSDAMRVPVNTTCLYRKVDSQTQTKKSRYNRWENVGDIFGVKNSEIIKDKFILLVDDVVTTGATIEGCAQALQLHNCKIYVVTIACA
jgi:ComF family protein